MPSYCSALGDLLESRLVDADQGVPAFRAEVTGVCSTHNVDTIRSIGADHVVDYLRQDFLEEVHRITNGAGVNVVLESVGGETLIKSIDALTFAGRLVSVGNTVAQPAPVDVSVLHSKAVSLFGLQMASDPFVLPPVLAEIRAGRQG